jgi:putative SOS response-associated peptidase YedK
MCGRLSLHTPVPDLEARFDATATREFAPRYNVAPGDELAVIRDEAPGRGDAPGDADRTDGGADAPGDGAGTGQADEGGRAIDAARWGLLPGWVDDPGDWPHPINARAETIAEKPSFRDAYERRRCLVLADGYYDWRGRRGSKQPYRFALEDDAPFAMAGLWERWRRDGETRRTCTVVTTEPNEVVEPIHHRMPVVLSPGEEGVWLRGGEDERRRLLRPYPGDDLRAYPVSTAVNDPENDRPGLIEPIDVGEQAGLDDFA